MKQTVRALTVDPSLRGIRLHDYLYRQFPDVRQAAIRALLERGQVQVNGMAQMRNVRLLPMDYVEVAAGEAELPRHHAPAGPVEAADARAAAPEALPVLCETGSILVVAKPAGLATVPERSGAGASLHGLLQELRPGDDLRIAHRLDRDTSGCLVLAKGLDAARHLDEQFRCGRVLKEYLALVVGRVTPARQIVELFLGPDPKRPGKVLAATTGKRGFRDAVTEVSVEEVLGRHSLLRLRPRTGRSHQLRVHLRAIGHPIVGDRDYGGEALMLSRIKAGYKLRPGVVERPLLDRMFLHAQALRLEDVCGTPVAVEAPLPSDLQLVLDKLRRFASRN